ncbi:MAG: twin-arginine translocase TatA/TatE family subunit [Nitrospirota bacterium]
MFDTRLPELGSGIGKAIKNLKEGISGHVDEIEGKDSGH